MTFRINAVGNIEESRQQSLERQCSVQAGLTAKPEAYSAEHTGPGYRFVQEVGISFQQLNSDRAWNETYRLASKFEIPDRRAMGLA